MAKRRDPEAELEIGRLLTELAESTLLEHQLAKQCIQLIATGSGEPNAQIVQNVACKMLDIVKQARSLMDEKVRR